MREHPCRGTGGPRSSLKEVGIKLSSVKIRNPKHEIRNKFQRTKIIMTKAETCNGIIQFDTPLCCQLYSGMLTGLVIFFV